MCDVDNPGSKSQIRLLHYTIPFIPHLNAQRCIKRYSFTDSGACFTYSGACFKDSGAYFTDNCACFTENGVCILQAAMLVL